MKNSHKYRRCILSIYQTSTIKLSQIFLIKPWKNQWNNLQKVPKNPLNSLKFPKILKKSMIVSLKNLQRIHKASLKNPKKSLKEFPKNLQRIPKTSSKHPWKIP